MITRKKFINICEKFGLKKYPDEYSDVFWYEIPGIDEEVCQFGSSSVEEWKGHVMCFENFYLDKSGIIKAVGTLKKCSSVKTLEKRIFRILSTVKRIRKEQRFKMIEDL